MLPFVTETVTGTLMVSVPSEIVIVVAPLEFVPMPIDVMVKTPVEAGAWVVATAIEAGDTVAMVASFVTAVIVPVKPLSTTVSCAVPFTPPNATFAGVALSGIGVGEGEGVGVGVAPDVVEDVPEDGELVGAAVAEPLGLTVKLVPPPPQPASNTKAMAPHRSAKAHRKPNRLLRSA